MARQRRLANVWGLLFILLLTLYPLVLVVAQVHDSKPPGGVESSRARVVDTQNPGRRTDRHIVTFRTTSGREGTLSTDRSQMPDTFTVWRDPSTNEWRSPATRSWVSTVLWLVFGTGLGCLLLVRWVTLFRQERSRRTPEASAVARS